MQIIRGKIESAQKICVYGPEGIGKSTFASQFPEPLFIDTEGSTKHMDVARLPKPSSWTMLLEQVKYIRQHPDICKTLVIDTADWAEQLCMNEICAKSQKKGMEDFGYGKGYVYLAEEFGRLLNLLEDLIEAGINVVLTAHAQMRKFEQPDEMGAYDRWELKLQKKTAPLVKEWADMVLFCNYKTFVVKTEGNTNKAQGGKRVIYTTHHPCWDAKNRHNLPEEIPLDYQAIAYCIPARTTTSQQAVPGKTELVQGPEPEPTPTPEPKPTSKPEPVVDMETFNEVAASLGFETEERSDLDGIPKALADLMWSNHVTPEEIQKVVAQRGYYPADTPITNYDPGFIDGVLVGAWEQVFAIIKQTRGGN